LDFHDLVTILIGQNKSGIRNKDRVMYNHVDFGQGEYYRWRFYYCNKIKEPQ
jgi:hypothetical protein